VRQTEQRHQQQYCVANNMESTLRFDEFRALRQRQRSTAANATQSVAQTPQAAQGVEPGSQDVDTKEAARKDKRTEATDSKAIGVSEAGAFFESVEVQMVTLALIVFDVAAAVVITTSACQVASDSSILKGAVNALESFLGFTVFYFLLEIVALLVSFGTKFFFHFGNLIDVSVVAISLATEMQGGSRVVRLLSLLRLWRLVRLTATFIDAKNVQLEDLREKNMKLGEDLEAARMETKRLEDAVNREVDSKKRIEKMLKSYRDEVETLNEALKIAALDIAMAADDQLQSDEDGESSARDEKPGEVKKNERAGVARKTFVVDADGSYKLGS